MDKPYYPVHMRWVAFALEKRGFPIMKIMPNKKKPEFNVYFFEDTLDFHKALIEVSQKK